MILIHGWPLNRASCEKLESGLLDARFQVITYAPGRRLPEVIKDNKYIEIKDSPHCIIQTHTNQVNKALMDFIS